MIGFSLHWEERLPEDVVDCINFHIREFETDQIDEDELRDVLLTMDMYPEEVETLIEDLVIEKSND